MPDNKALWGTVLQEIEADVSQANFGTWFKNTGIVKQDNEIIYLGVPNSFVKEWLTNKYHKVILRALRNAIPEIHSLEYLIVKTEELNQQKGHVEAVVRTTFGQQLGFEEFNISKEDNLNPKYTFDAFVVGPFNELAHAAAQAVVKNIGVAYNPLFVYGGTGVGKTHLIQAVGNTIKKNCAAKKIFYVPSEQFVFDYVNSVQNNRVNLFKEKYRQHDVLIMDDVQFLSAKDKTQEELFHLFNNFYENNKQIVFSSDKSPKYIPDIEDRLRSRFEGGMIVDIARPDFESRLAILKSKLKNCPFHPAGEVVEYVALVIQNNIRELEGTLNLVVCQSQLKNRDLTLPEVKTLIKNNIKPKKTISIKNIASIVADFYHIEEKTLYEKTRKKEIVKPRQVTMYLLREDFNTSYPYIGQKLGGRDHTTVIHAYEKIKRDLKVNQFLSQEIEQIRTLLFNFNSE